MAVIKSESPEENKKSAPAGIMSAEMQQKLLDQVSSMAEKLDALEKKNTESKSADSSENLIRELTRALGNKGSLDQLDATGYIDANLIDKDDILSEDEIVRFYAHVSTYVIVDDLRHGTPVRTPFGNVIKFEYIASKTSGSGKHKEIEHSCVYRCRSKKEAEWLKEHALYGTMFYSSGKDNMTIDGKKATRMALLMKNLMGLEKHQIMSMCQQNGIEMMEKVSDMRMALANKLSSDIMDREKEADGERVKEMLFTKKEFEIE